MTAGRERLIAVLIRCAAAILACAGLYVTVFSSGGFMSVSGFYYYTVQSNIWALIIALAGLVFAISGIKEPGWLKMTRFVVAVAIMVTFLVFWTMLVTTVPASYLVSLSNLTLHTLVPLMTLADALFADKGHIPTKKQVLFCSVPPFWYLGFAMTVAAVSPEPRFPGSRYPYWFLDVDRYGWFSFKNGVGVFYWVLVVIAIVLGLGYLMRYIKLRLYGKRTVQNEAKSREREETRV